MKTPDILEVTFKVVKAFDILGIEYYIGGSVASSAYGVARSTLDIDMVADMDSDQAQALAQLLKKDFYVDVDTINKAIAHHSSFNIIHLDSMLKIDIFIYREQPFSQRVFLRREEKSVSDEFPEKLFFPSPEDIILIKLDWYKSSGESLCHQWSDVLGVLKVQRTKLDLDYLKKWAEEMSVLRLLEKALGEAGLGEK